MISAVCFSAVSALAPGDGIRWAAGVASTVERGAVETVSSVLSSSLRNVTIERSTSMSAVHCGSFRFLSILQCVCRWWNRFSIEVVVRGIRA